MIIDNHVHVHPGLGPVGELKYLDRGDATRRDRYAQKLVYLWARSPRAQKKRAIRRVKDDSPVDDAWRVLWDERRWGNWDGILDAGLHVEGDRAVWTAKAQRVYLDLRLIRYRPCPPDLLLRLMDETGVDVCVIQAGYHMIRYTSDLVKQHPGRFIGLIQIEWGEEPLPQQIDQFVRAHETFGLTAFRLAPHDQWTGFYDFHEPQFEPLWRYIADHGIVTTIGGGYDGSAAPFEVFLPRFKQLLDRFPNLRFVIEHGLPSRFFRDESDTDPGMKQLAVDLIRNHEVCMEAIPYHGVAIRNLCPALPQVVEKVGIDKIVWGSEMLVFQPVGDETPEHYRTSRTYFEEHCPFLSQSDRAKILGGNLMRSHGLQ